MKEQQGQRARREGEERRGEGAEKGEGGEGVWEITQCTWHIHNVCLLITPYTMQDQWVGPADMVVAGPMSVQL